MCTRLLYTVLPSPYTKDSFQRLLRLLTDDLKSLQEPGFTVDWNGKKHNYRLIFTGCKGDWPFLRAAYGLNCGYNCTAKCHRCDLQEWYDVKGAMRSLTPSATNPNPFKADEPRSPLRDLLTGDDTRYIRIDPAHTFAIDGIGKDFLASTIVMLVRMWHFGRGNAGHALQNAYASFMAYCSARKKTTSIQDFSFATLKLPQNTLKGFPRGLGKGHDAAVLGAWLAEEVQQISAASVDPQYRDILEVIKLTCCSNDRFWRTIYEHGVWIPYDVGVQIVQDGWAFTDGYSTLASLTAAMGIHGYHTRPKLHMQAHITLDMQHQLARPGCKFILSPSAHMCWTDEDMIGRISRLSRRCHALTTARRTIDRALCNYRRLFSIHFSGSYMQNGNP